MKLQRSGAWSLAKHARQGLVALLGGFVLAGCATKRDVRDLRDEIVRLEQKQDSLHRALTRQNQMLLDTVKASFNLQMDVRGQTSHRFQQLEDNLGRMEALVQQLLMSNEQLSNRLLEQQRQGQPNMGAPVGAVEATEMYEAGVRLQADRAYETARGAFEQIVTQYPNDPVAADAQYQIGETYYSEERYDDAIEALQEVERRWSQSPRAPAALLRAGIISQEQGDADRARTFYEQVRQRYPMSDEANLAAQRLRAIG